MIDELDKKILNLISCDARVPFLEVARKCKVSGAAIHQRMQKLHQMGIIKGSQYLFDPALVGNGTCAFIGILLRDPSDSDRVLAELMKIPEIVECHLTTGNYDMFIKIYTHDNAHLLSVIHEKLQPIGIQRSETMVSFSEPIHRQMPIYLEQ
ncbi:MAG: Lrp/AsnC ligand binding domain-containing protein [Bacteroidaceae bacterium]|jgi:Lrp/AsnC family transcriptional regulator for asnA, asnC and gidA|nr:Lrp/AsnC ligand binding domain-containing protein [Bacteroidaceae bacterium]